MAAPIPPVSGHEVIHTRYTKGGRKLFYRLEVIQQPERARACGSGPKSSADRRPVDPPPVVELRIFEGPTLEQSKDVTFLYNANFFLFATLEHARVIAHGRVQPPTANTPPVLTGMPVSGMAYLDRPQEAGYFLFPDLSVRHEGRYRLSFNLYEQTKEESDMDKEPNPHRIEGGESFDWRLEVKSQEFVVYSAKKFPGLTESTALSRTVAEQGCRVRIRRDVRMRRRDGKGAGDFDNAEDEYARRRRTQTPEAEREFRARSLSTESAQRTPYSADPQRRSSGTEYPPPPPSFGGGSQPPNGSHLTFGGQPTSHYQQPYPREHAQSSSVPPSPSYGPGQAAAFTYPPPQSHGYYQERPPSRHYAAPDPSPKRDPYGQDARRPSGGAYGRPITPMEKEMAKPEPPHALAPPAPHHAAPPCQLPPISSLTRTLGEPGPAMTDPRMSIDQRGVERRPSDVRSIDPLLLPDSDPPLISPTLDRGSKSQLQGKKRNWVDANPATSEVSETQSCKNGSRQKDSEGKEAGDPWYKRADGSITWTKFNQFHPR